MFPFQIRTEESDVLVVGGGLSGHCVLEGLCNVAEAIVRAALAGKKAGEAILDRLYFYWGENSNF